MSFGMAVAFMMFIKELRRNGDETVENRHQPPNYFLPFLDEIYISELFELNLIFFKKFTQTFALSSCVSLNGFKK